MVGSMISSNTVHVRLSRRNLLVLLSKLDGHPEGSACSLIRACNGILFMVDAEEDAEHYGERQPGPMHHETEAEILQKKSILLRESLDRLMAKLS